MLQVPTWVQRASPVRVGTVQREMLSPCFRVFSLSTRLQLLEVVLVETVSFQPRSLKLCGKERQGAPRSQSQDPKREV